MFVLTVAAFMTGAEVHGCVAAAYILDDEITGVAGALVPVLPAEASREDRRKENSEIDEGENSDEVVHLHPVVPL